MPDMPEGWSSVKMSDIFTREQMDFITQTYNDNGGDVFEVSRVLKPYFRKIAAQLQAKGLLPDYAAYAIPVWMSQQAQPEEESTDSMVDRIMGRGGKPENN